jgi:predicted dehydrogenase
VSAAAVAHVGVVGCGVVAHRYVEGSAVFDTFDVIACADLDGPLARAFAQKHDLRPQSVEELLSDPEIDVVLNLTPPTAHAAVSSSALEAGKHVYTEKPLATSLSDGTALVAESERRGVRIGCAPDTFLGSAYQAGRELVARGDIGVPLGASATMLLGGPDAWHPNADDFYRAGSGPILDIGPYYLTAIVALLGPIEEVVAFTSTLTPTRTLGVGPRTGERFAVDVPTHVASVLRLESDAIATLTVGFEARGQYVSGLVVHGSEGSLELPDANEFGGELRVRHGRGDWSTVPYMSRGTQERRGIGLDEMLEAVRERRPHQASGELGLHVLGAALAVLSSATDGHAVEVDRRARAGADFARRLRRFNAPTG